MSSSGTLYKCDVCGWQPEQTTDIHNCKAISKDKLRALVEEMSVCKKWEYKTAIEQQIWWDRTKWIYKLEQLIGDKK